MMHHGHRGPTESTTAGEAREVHRTSSRTRVQRVCSPCGRLPVCGSLLRAAVPVSRGGEDTPRGPVVGSCSAWGLGTVFRAGWLEMREGRRTPTLRQEGQFLS